MSSVKHLVKQARNCHQRLRNADYFYFCAHYLIVTVGLIAVALALSRSKSRRRLRRRRLRLHRFFCDLGKTTTTITTKLKNIPPTNQPTMIFSFFFVVGCSYLAFFLFFSLLFSPSSVSGESLMSRISSSLSGGELFEQITSEGYTMSEAEVINYMRQICEGVKHMHERNIIHLGM